MVKLMATLAQHLVPLRAPISRRDAPAWIHIHRKRCGGAVVKSTGGQMVVYCGQLVVDCGQSWSIGGQSVLQSVVNWRSNGGQLVVNRSSIGGQIRIDIGRMPPLRPSADPGIAAGPWGSHGDQTVIPIHQPADKTGGQTAV